MGIYVHVISHHNLIDILIDIKCSSEYVQIGVYVNQSTPNKVEASFKLPTFTFYT